MALLAVAAGCDGIQRFSAAVLIENHPMRIILEHYGAVWRHDQLGVVTTVADVPLADRLPLPPELSAQICDMARQVIRAVA